MELKKIPSSLFVKNRSKLIRELKENSCCIVFSNDEMPRNGDQYFPFRQNSNFFYLTGIQQEKSVLILSPGHPEKAMREILFIIKPDPIMETWNGRKLSKEKAAEYSGISRIEYLGDYEALLKQVIEKNINIYLHIPEIPKFNPEMETQEVRMAGIIKKKWPLHSYHRLAPVFLKLRSVKEYEEIDSIRKACELTGNAFTRVMEMLSPGVREREVEAEISYEFIRNGAKLAFPIIAGSGANACILHYTENTGICKDGDLLLIDFGAEVNNYASDCSRTIPVNGKFSPRQAEIYDRLHDILTHAISLMVPGRTMQEVHQTICKNMQILHTDLGLYSKKEAKTAPPENPLWFKYYMHGSGHSLGLDVHDIYEKDAAFCPGMIFTCEPGVYIPEENLGIRIENDILITSEGNEDLMKNIPSKREDIELIMAKA